MAKGSKSNSVLFPVGSLEASANTEVKVAGAGTGTGPPIGTAMMKVSAEQTEGISIVGSIWSQHGYLGIASKG